jgi:hypothetical protein
VPDIVKIAGELVELEGFERVVTTGGFVAVEDERSGGFGFGL